MELILDISQKEALKLMDENIYNSSVGAVFKKNINQDALLEGIFDKKEQVFKINLRKKHYPWFIHHFNFIKDIKIFLEGWRGISVSITPLNEKQSTLIARVGYSDVYIMIIALVIIIPCVLSFIIINDNYWGGIALLLTSPTIIFLIHFLCNVTSAYAYADSQLKNAVCSIFKPHITSQS